MPVGYDWGVDDEVFAIETDRGHDDNDKEVTQKDDYLIDDPSGGRATIMQVIILTIKIENTSSIHWCR